MIVVAAFTAFACERGTAERGWGDGTPVDMNEPLVPLVRRETSDVEPIGPEPDVLFVYDGGGVYGLLVDDTHAYFTNGNDELLRRVAKEAGDGTEVVGQVGGGARFDGDQLIMRVQDQTTGNFSFYEYDKATLDVRTVPLPEGYYYRSVFDDGAYYAFGLGCSGPTRLDRVTGETVMLPFEPFAIGGHQPVLVTDAYVYCANAFDLMRVAKDFQSPPETLFKDFTDIRVMHWSPPRVLWLQSGIDVNTKYAQGSPPHSFYEMAEDTLEYSRIGIVDRPANTGGFSHDPSTDCFYYSDAGVKYGSVQYYCLDGRADYIVGNRNINGGVDIDEQFVYWAERGGIMRLPKPVLPE
jgi:hypothetical protein